jgi:Caspase domain
MTVIRFFLSILFWLLTACSSSELAAKQSDSVTQTNSPAHALLIGIGDYHAPGLNPLRSPKNDLALSKALLIERFGLPESQITILQDQQATHTNIQKAFADLTQRVKPGEFVYIYYAGHGAVTPDGNGDETNGEDQTWVTYGARENDSDDLDNWDILDDELYDWLSALRAKTDQIVFVSDSCHSGSVSRAPMVEVRYAPKDIRLHPLAKQPHKVKPYSDKDLGIRIGAAVDTNFAYGNDRDGKDYGDFTYYWVKALYNTKPGETWRAVFDRTVALMNADPKNRQQPQLTGNANRSVFGGQFVAVPNSIPIAKVESDNRMVLKAGSVNGITVGSRYRRLDPAIPNETSPACVTITSTDLFQSQATYTAKDCTLAIGDQLTEVEHHYALTPYRLHLKGDYPKDKDKALLSQLQQSLSKLNGFTLVDDKTQADWVAYVVRPKTGRNLSSNTQLPESDPKQAPQAWVIDPQGKLIHDRLKVSLSDPNIGINELNTKLNQYARIQEFKALTGTGQIPVTVMATRYSPAQQCNNSSECLTLNEKKYRKSGIAIPLAQLATQAPKLDDILVYSASNESDDEIYLYIVNVDANGKILSVFPSNNDNQETARLNKTQTDAKRKITDLQRYNDFNPSGANTLKVIVTKQPIDFHLFEMAELSRTESFRGSNPLEKFLIGNMESRNASGNLNVGTWSTQQVEFEVK